MLDETGGEGVDLVVEVGGVGTCPLVARHPHGRHHRPDGRALRPSRTAAAAHDPAQAGPHSGIYVGSRRDFEEMNAGIALAGLHPVVESHPWTEARAVLRRMEAGDHFGKLVVTID